MLIKNVDGVLPMTHVIIHYYTTKYPGVETVSHFENVIEIIDFENLKFSFFVTSVSKM